MVKHSLKDTELIGTVLVTGGAGFIGSAFIRMLLTEQPDCHVVNLDRMTYAATRSSIPDAAPHRYRLVEGDIGDRCLVKHLLATEQPDWIVNFAAESHVDRSIDGPDAFVLTNVVGTFHFLDETMRWWRQLPEDRKNSFRLLHVSTDEVYGSLGPLGYFNEESRYLPNSPYQFPEKLIPLISLNAIEGKELPLYGNGTNIRDWLFVEDHCRALHTVLQRGTVGQVYNIGGECERSNVEVVEAILRHRR